MSLRHSVLVLTLGAGLAAPSLCGAATVVKLDPATQRRLGIETVPLAAEARTASVSGFARVLDAIPLASLDADIAQATAALAASRAEAARTRALNADDQTVSRRVADAAAAQAGADAAKLQLLRRRLGLEWGPVIARLSDARRSALVNDLAAGRAALVRIDLPAGPAQPGGSAVIDLGPGGRAEAALLGPTRTGDPRLQTTGLLGIVRGPAALRLGLGIVAPATLRGAAATRGVVIPRAALLRTAGQTFAYVRRDGGFERRPLAGALADPGGLFVTGGFRPGEAVVVSGAAKLFAAETPSQAAQ